MSTKKVGIVGGGQLGRMLALAGYPLGIDCRLLDREAGCPGGQIAELVTGALDDAEALARLADGVDVVTIEIENVAVAPLEALAARVPVYPPPAAIAAAQDRLREKQLFGALGIPSAAFAVVDTAQDLEHAVRDVGLPLLLKLRRMGYDGRGQRVVRRASEAAAAWAELGEGPAIAERFVEFEREVSLIAVRGTAGELAFYPLAENTHRDGILHTTTAPYDDAKLQRQAEGWLAGILERFDYRGVLTVEFFATGSGLVANEIAPRVHNSGHWTIEGAETSQFENHLRAIVGWPLGDASPRGHSAMVNLLGRMPDPPAVLAIPGAHLHDYGKAPRPARKVGHCTLVDRDRDRLRKRLAALGAALGTE